jgi:hypothetical protein
MVWIELISVFLRKSSRYTATIFGAAVAFEVLFDNTFQSVFDNINKGVRKNANIRDNGRTFVTNM